jgi:hypothetical protein
MGAFEYLAKQQRDKDNKFLARFGPLPKTLRIVRDHSELEALRKAGVGFVINIRGDQSTIHRADCEAIQAMVTSEHRKLFCDDARDATQWLNTDQEGTWKPCGRCDGPHT